MESKLIWRNVGGKLYLTSEAVEVEKLDAGVYLLNWNERDGHFLTKEYVNFTFDYKIYGLETDIIDRVVKTYQTSNKGNLGVMFNGLRGTGKTVSGKLLCNLLDQPTIIVNVPYPNSETFLNRIPQNITIFVDEYEKIYKTSSEMLTIMDGVMNAKYRRAFILTTNQLRVEENLIQRPSRIRYLKEFSHLKPNIVEEIIDDILEYPEYKSECIKFISSLELITVDIVKSILQEVNIHNESPEKFGDVFNVKKLTGKYNIYTLGEGEIEQITAKNIDIYPRPKYSENTIGYHLEIDNTYLGQITNVLDENIIEVTQYKVNEKGERTNIVDKVHIFKVEDAFRFHSNYVFNGSEGFKGSDSKASITQSIKEDLIRANSKVDANSNL